MLPYVDEHQLVIAAPPETVWAALRSYVDRSLIKPSLATWLLKTQPATGFQVAGEVPLTEVRLTGRHRFSDYELVFSLAQTVDGTSLSARTYAKFPGTTGAVYRALVIGTGFHVLAVRRMLHTVGWLCGPQRGDKATQ